MSTMYTKHQLPKVALLSSVLSLMVSPFSLAQSDDLEQCRSIQDTAKRLICYDKALGRVTTETGEEDKTAPNDDLDDIDKRVQALMKKANKSEDPFSSSAPRLSGNPVGSSASADNSFGSEHLKKEGVDTQDAIRLSITNLKKDYLGKATFTMSNGQVWKQTETVSFSADTDDTVIIEKGVWGAYFLKKPDSNKRIRVKRIK